MDEKQAGSPFTLPAVDLARRLLGWELLRREADGSWTGGVIVETEAYPGGADLASHTALGRRTARNESMYLPGGHLYVYLIYGMHHCLNVVSGEAGSGEAVLVRSLRPNAGLRSMRDRRPGRSDRDLARGPGRLCAALGVDRSFDGERIGGTGSLILRSGIEPEGVLATPRVGIESSGEWATRRWRFLCGDRTWWSVRPTEVGC